MFKKIVVAMSTFLILISCVVPFSVSADYNANYDYKINGQYKNYEQNGKVKYYLLVRSYKPSTDKTIANIIGFSSIPTLFYNETENSYYFKTVDGGLLGEFDSTNGSHVEYTNINYIYIDKINLTKYGSSEILKYPVYSQNFNSTTYIKKSDVESNFTPIFDESCSDLDKILWGHTLSDDAFNGYYDDVIIEVKPKIESEQLKSWKIDKSFLRPDIPTKLSYDLSDYFFTVSVTNKGAESFEFIMTANSSNYTTRYETNQSMINSSSDILNTFQVDGKALISVEPNSTASFNFNFSEIDHFDKIANSWGGNMYQTFHKIFLNFWTQQFYRMSYDGLPVYHKPVYNEDGTINEEESEKLGAKIFGRSESYLCTYSHDFSFYGNWVTKAEKPANYDDVVNQLPIADIISGNGYGSVEFDLNPDMDDFKGMLDSSKGFLEFVRYTMANFVPQFFWVLIAAGLTSIIILRILGR